MFICTLKFDRKKAVFIIAMAALVLIGIILLVGAFTGGGAKSEAKAALSARNEKGRAAYLAACGWTVETPALSEDTVLIPKQFSPVFEEYNELQRQQGFDLSDYCGMEVTMYTYRVLDSGREGEVLAVLYVLNGAVVGGDVHSTALDGFMCGIKSAN